MKVRAKVMLGAALASLTAGCQRGGLVCQWFGWGCPPPNQVPGVGPGVVAPSALPAPPPVILEDAHKHWPPVVAQSHPGQPPPALIEGLHAKPVPPRVVVLHPGHSPTGNPGG